jgi:7-keto-8-aminopelargonate synthetase-like enzyme
MCAFFTLQGRIDIINSTLGKALGGATGGYTTSSKEVVEMLRNKGRPYLFSNTLAPMVVGASISMFDMISNDTSLRDKVCACVCVCVSACVRVCVREREKWCVCVCIFTCCIRI